MCRDAAKEKREVRKAVLKIRDGLREEERKKAALLLTERILGHQWFYLSEYFLCFASYGSEIGTDELLREALKAGKKVFVPRVEGEEMHFCRVLDPAELKSGYRGIPEPFENAEEYLYSEEAAGNTLMLMPGVAFDRYRNRIGYGKGFYDRFLAGKKELQLRTIAVGYRCQLLEKLPVSGTDIRPSQIICV